MAEAANDMRQVQGTVHFGAQAPGNAKASGGLSLEWGSLADDFHVFAVEWELTEVGGGMMIGCKQAGTARDFRCSAAGIADGEPRTHRGCADTAAPLPRRRLLQMRWYLDDAHYFTAYSAGTGREGGWYSVGEGAGPDAPFDSPFYLILNLAVGGPTTAFTGYVPLGDTLASPKQLLVDYVRVHGLPFALSQRTRRRRGA